MYEDGVKVVKRDPMALFMTFISKKDIKLKIQAKGVKAKRAKDLIEMNKPKPPDALDLSDNFIAKLQYRESVTLNESKEVEDYLK